MAATFGSSAEINQSGANEMNGRILKFILVMIMTSVMQCGAATVDFDRANKFFDSGSFSEAAAVYQDIIRSEGTSVSLLYNLGNCYFRTGDYGKAILCYERARLLAPRDPDLNANLAQARKAAAVFDKGPMDPRLEAVLTYLSRNEWSWLVVSCAIWIGLVSIGLAFARSTRPSQKRLVLASVGLAGLVILASAVALFLRREESSRGIVLGKEAAIYLSPFEKAETVGVPGMGRIVQMGEIRGGFCYVSVTGTDLRGWMRDWEVTQILSEK